MTNIFQDRAQVAAPLHAEPCFLCALDTHPCQIPRVEGQLIGARVERRGTQQVPVVGLKTSAGERVRINLGPLYAPLVERLAVLPATQLHALHFRVLHLLPGKANPPAPGQDPFRVMATTAASLAIIAPDLLLNITDLSHGNYCVRQEVLRELFPGPPNAAGLRGTIIHNIFKEMLKDATAQPDHLMQEGLRASVVTLAEMGANELDLQAEMEPHLASLARWREQQQEQLWKDTPHVRAETFLLAPKSASKGGSIFSGKVSMNAVCWN